MTDTGVPKRSEPLRRDAAANRERLLLAGMRVLRDGEGAAPIERICEEAGVTRATFYRHFADVIVEILKLAAISPAEMNRRVRIRNAELFTDHFAAGLLMLAAAVAVYTQIGNLGLGLAPAVALMLVAVPLFVFAGAAIRHWTRADKVDHTRYPVQLAFPSLAFYCAFFVVPLVFLLL